jgi:hypothetical protein
LLWQVDSSGRSTYQAIHDEGRVWQYVFRDPGAFARRIVTNAYYTVLTSFHVLTPLPWTTPLPVRLLLFAVASYGVLACWQPSRDVAIIAEWFMTLGGPGVAALIDSNLPPPPELERLTVLGSSPTRMFIYKVRPGS